MIKILGDFCWCVENKDGAYYDDIYFRNCQILPDGKLTHCDGKWADFEYNRGELRVVGVSRTSIQIV